MDEELLYQARRWKEFKDQVYHRGLTMVMPCDKEGNFDIPKIVELVAFALFHQNKVKSTG